MKHIISERVRGTPAAVRDGDRSGTVSDRAHSGECCHGKLPLFNDNQFHFLPSLIDHDAKLINKQIRNLLINVETLYIKKLLQHLRGSCHSDVAI